MLKEIFVSPAEDDRKLNVFLILPSPCEGNLPVLDTIADPQYGNFFGNTDRRFVFDFDVLF
jgi:hypothetical protein